MEDYQHLYYALFNRISDMIALLESEQADQKIIIQALKALQAEAEERFLSQS